MKNYPAPDAKSRCRSIARRGALAVSLGFALPLAAGCGKAARHEVAADFEAHPVVAAPPAAASTVASKDPPKKGGVAFASLGLPEALRRAGAEKKLVMVDLYTDWCGWCKKLDREVFSHPDVGAATSSSVVAIKINAEAGGESLTSRYQVNGFPTILFLDSKGKLVRRVEGFVGVGELVNVLNGLPRTQA